MLPQTQRELLPLLCSSVSSAETCFSFRPYLVVLAELIPWILRYDSVLHNKCAFILPLIVKIGYFYMQIQKLNKMCVGSVAEDSVADAEYPSHVSSM